MNKNNLPAKFHQLEVLVPEWALPTEAERNSKRCESSMQELGAFRSAIEEHLDEIVGHLDSFTVGSLEGSERNLLHLMQMYMEVALAIDLYGQPELPVAFPRDRFQINTPPRPEYGEIGMRRKASKAARRNQGAQRV